MNLEELRIEHDRWLQAARDLSPHTVRAYASDVLALERFLGCRFEARHLSADDLYRFLEHLRLGGLSSASIRRRLSGVRTFCGWLHNQGIVSADPSQQLSVRFSKARRLPRALSDHDLRRLLRHLCEAAHVRHLVPGSAATCRPLELTTLLAVSLMVGTGLRAGELVSIRLSDVDLPSRTILVVGKGLRERVVYLSNEWISDLLGLYVASRPAAACEHECLVVNRDGMPLSTAALRARLARAAVVAGLDATVTPHMLRHTAATQLIEAGVDIRFVQRLLGHASLTTTEIYTHVADTSLRRAVVEADVLGRALTSR